MTASVKCKPKFCGLVGILKFVPFLGDFFFFWLVDDSHISAKFCNAFGSIPAATPLHRSDLLQIVH